MKTRRSADRHELSVRRLQLALLGSFACVFLGALWAADGQAPTAGDAPAAPEATPAGEAPAGLEAPAAGDAKAEKGERWTPLFNGKDLQGWTPKIKGYDLGDNHGDTFSVEDGILKVSYDRYGGKFDGRFGHIFHKETFSSYRLRVEYRFVGSQLPDGAGWALRNSGIMLHGQSPESMRKDQDFPVSIEVQLLGGDGKNKRSTANLCTPGTNVVMAGELVTRHCNDSRSRTYHGDRWVTVEVEVRGGKTIKHFVEGELVLEYDEPQLDPSDGDARKLIEAAKGEKILKGGTISLQSESHPVEFRKVEILRLDDEAAPEGAKPPAREAAPKDPEPPAREGGPQR